MTVSMVAAVAEVAEVATRRGFQDEWVGSTALAIGLESL